MQLKIETELQTKNLAQEIAPFLKKGDVVFLIGTLGAGKTALARYLVQSLIRDDENVPSPTFTLIQSYSNNEVAIDHYDLYRLDENDAQDDIIELGWEESLSNAITLVEWPDRLNDLKPKDRLEIYISFKDSDQRIIDLKKFGSWEKRLTHIQDKSYDG